MRLVWMAWLLACLVVPLGAYVRLSQAGLGCPDWPGCFGQLSPRQARVRIDRAVQVQPDGPVSPGKAWREMVHRYLASMLGATVLVLALRCYRRRQHRALGALMLAGVLLQGMLGMLTVTWLLKPVVVSGHLVLGMALAAGLAAWAWRSRLAAVAAPPGVRRQCGVLLALLLAQILLGGWVSSNHAALACAGFPACNGAWWPPLRFGDAYRFLPGAGAPDGLALVTIQWTHRLGALLVSLALLALVWRGWRVPRLRPGLVALVCAWLVQLTLGAANVLLGLPFALAWAHHVGALVLLSLTMVLAARLRRVDA